MRNLQNQYQMNKYFTLIATMVLGTMISCSPAQKESKPAAVQQQNQVQQPILTADTSAISSVPVNIPAPAASVEPTAINKSATPPELNPPHGQPYHRCDIPVGSPLNAAAAPAKTTQVINRTGTAPTLENAARLNNPQPNNSIATAPANSAPPKLNPPHGQPFHRCDIAVGSPLPLN
jgi:hypothetical protein